MANRTKPPFGGANVTLINNPSNVAPLTTSTSTPTTEATAAALATETAARIAADAALTTTIAGLGSGVDLSVPGPIGGTTPNTAAFTTLSASGAVSGAGFTSRFAAPGPVGNTTPSTGAFTTLSASGAVSGTGFTNLHAAPGPIGNTTPSTGAFTTLSASGTVSGAGFTNFVQALINVVPANTQTSSYTAVLADAGTCIEMNSASAVNLTVPPHSSVALPVGTIIEWYQMGAGQITFVAGAGVTLRNGSSFTSRAQYSSGALRQRATDEWVLLGDVT